jgi:hypothetical protein
VNESNASAAEIDADSISTIRITIAVEDEPAAFEIKRDGTGTCTIDDEGEATFDVTIEFFEDLLQAAVRGEHGEVLVEDDRLTIESEADSSDLRDVFDEQVNHQLNDRFLSDDELQDQDVTFGGPIDDAQFERLVHLAQVAYIIASGNRSPFQTVLSCADEFDDCLGIAENADDETPQILEPVIEAILEYASPKGWSWEYNDGANNRQSGYSCDAAYLTYESSEALEAIPVREQVQAARILVQEAKALGLDLAADVDEMIASFTTEQSGLEA